MYEQIMIYLIVKLIIIVVIHNNLDIDIIIIKRNQKITLKFMILIIEVWSLEIIIMKISII
jgi:hypothetical protein